jgi:PAS domain S-box-containing protein
MSSSARRLNESSHLENGRQGVTHGAASDQAFDDLNALAAQVCRAPVSVLFLADAKGPWCKSRTGLTPNHASRASFFCHHTMLGADVLLVPDTLKDSRFADNPIVVGEPRIRFYAGAPLIDRGEHLGALCIMDVVPRDLSSGERNALLALSRQVVSQLELQHQSQELAASELRLHQVFRNCPVALSIHRWSDRTFVDVNPACTSLLGWKSEELAGRTTTDLRLVDPQAAATIRSQLSADGILKDVELTVSTRSGDTRRVLMGTSKVTLQRETHVITTFVDITNRTKAEQALISSQARYQALFELAPDGILIADQQSRYLDANLGMCQMLGYTREELIGKHASDIVAPSEVAHIAPALAEISTHAGHNREWIFRRKDGSTFSAEVIVRPMPDGNLLAMIRDITERKRIEARFRRLMESNAQGVMFWKTSGEITQANDALLRLTGYTRDDLEAGRLRWSAMTPPEYAHLDERSLREMAAKGICTPFEKEYIRKDGTRVPIFIGAAVFEDDPGEGVSFVIDLTERNKLEQQFLRAQRMESIGTLASGIAHDLNNVLAPILLSLDMLGEPATTEDHASLLDLLRTSTEHGVELVRQVLSFARGVSGQRIPVNPLPLLNDLLKVMRDTFPKTIVIRCLPVRDLWTITGDPTQLHQVFLNLCVNARDAMPEGGTLSITMENVRLDETFVAMNLDAMAGAFVKITVADTGTGISSEIRDRIFEPFFTTKETGKGTGLGLSTTMAIVKSHGGFINPYSEVGRGSKFEVYLPAQTVQAEVEPQSGTAELQRGNGETVLVIDDEEAIRTVVQGTLERFGYHVILASNGAQALAIYRRQHDSIDVVLTDMAMPVMDGPATIIALRAINPEVRIVGSSGLSSNAEVTKLLGVGIKHFVSKPYTAETLLAALQRGLKPD